MVKSHGGGAQVGWRLRMNLAGWFDLHVSSGSSAALREFYLPSSGFEGQAGEITVIRVRQKPGADYGRTRYLLFISSGPRGVCDRIVEMLNLRCSRDFDRLMVSEDQHSARVIVDRVREACEEVEMLIDRNVAEEAGRKPHVGGSVEGREVSAVWDGPSIASDKGEPTDRAATGGGWRLPGRPTAILAGIAVGLFALVGVSGGAMIIAELKGDIRGLATKADIEALATKADIEALATKADIGALATKADIEALATKADIEALATKADIEALATKADIEALATKADVEALATKAFALDRDQDQVRDTKFDSGNDAGR